MAKVLLVDTSFAAAPIYEYLVDQQHDVYVAGNRATDMLALKAGKNWINVNYSQLTVMKELVKEYQFDFIVPGCTDISLEVCQQLGILADFFDSPDTYKYLGSKQYFRQLCSELELCAPRVVNFEDFPLPGRYICKPTDAFSGRGVSVFDGGSKEATEQAFELAKYESRSSEVVCETYVEGQLYSFSAFIEDKKVEEGYIVLEGSSVNPYAVDTSFVVTDFPEDIQKQLRKDTEHIASHLQLTDGLIHVQFILSDSKAYLIEITRRCPGDLYSKLIEYSTGCKYAAKYASYFINGNKVKSERNFRYVIRHTVTSDFLCTFDSLCFNNSMRVKAFYPLMSLGSEALPLQKSRVGILFVESDSVEQIKDTFESFMSRKSYKLFH